MLKIRNQKADKGQQLRTKEPGQIMNQTQRERMNSKAERNPKGQQDRTGVLFHPLGVAPVQLLYFKSKETMTDRELFNNKCPYTNKKCLNNWNCSECETEKAEREYMQEIERELLNITRAGADQEQNEKKGTFKNGKKGKENKKRILKKIFHL